jgi:hypothetical protein
MPIMVDCMLGHTTTYTASILLDNTHSVPYSSHCMYADQRLQ